MKYGVLMADIISSRTYSDSTRYYVQKLVKSNINLLNKFFASSLKSEVEISSGDQIQGIFYDVEACFLYYRLFDLLMFPVNIRAGIGFGELYFDEGWKSNELDGKVYHHAKHALEMAKAKKLKICFYNNSEDDKFLNMLLISSSLIANKEGITTSLTSLFAELLFPIQYKFYPNINFVNDENKSLIKDCLKLKEKIYLELNKDDEYPLIDIKQFFDHFNDAKYINIVDYLDNKDFIIDAFWKKGFSTKIGDILTIKRQIVDRHFKYANIDIKRNMDSTIILYLHEKITKGG